MNGASVAIFGLGRSGLAIGKAVKELGGEPHIFDETPFDRLAKPELYDSALADGIAVTLNWQGEFTDQEWDSVVVNPAVPLKHKKILRAEAAGQDVIGEIEFAYRISKAPIVAITGTNGKSTTTVMTVKCLEACGQDAVLCGNVFGSGYSEIPLTEAALNSTPDQILVAEVSSFQLDRVVDFKPAVAGITNISADHMDRYDSFEDYAKAKKRIFAKQDQSDFAVVRSDDPLVSSTNAALPTVFQFGTGDVEAEIADDALVIFGTQIKASDLPFAEPHNLANAAMAALLAYSALAWKQAHGLQGQYDELWSADGSTRALPESIVDGLKSFRGLAHRMEIVGEKAGVRIVNNSMCTNPGAVVASLNGVRGKAHVLIGGINKGLDFAPLSEALASSEHSAYLFGSDASPLNAMLGGGHPVYETMAQAFQAATDVARGGETVILAPGCASTDQFRDFIDRGDRFREIAQRWIGAGG